VVVETLTALQNAWS